MKTTFVKKSTALVLLATLAACGGSNGNAALGAANAIPAAAPNVAAKRPVLHPHFPANIIQNIVGIGDSLTAGYQAGGFLGATNVKNPLNTTPPFNLVPPGQESGFWAVLREQADVANGGHLTASVDGMYDPATSPLPLIAGPGLNNQVVSSASTIVGELKSGNTCADDNGFNQAGYQLNGITRTRLNPFSTAIRDFGVPGITLHEANVMTQPTSPTCNEIPGVPGLLSQIVAGESSTFYPVLGGYNKRVYNPTMVNIAASVNPSLATVWLGANDLLKFMGSGGLFTAGDNTPAEVETDLRATIQRMEAANSAVVVANLPEVLHLAYFSNMQTPSNLKICNVQQYFACFLSEFTGASPQAAAKVTAQIAAAYGLSAPGCVAASTTAPCGYLTLPGALSVIAALSAGKPVPNLDPTGPGSGLGNSYITPSLAGRIQALNLTINQGISQAAKAEGVPLVDVATILNGIASGDKSNHYYRQASGINPGVCCTLVFLGGFLSFDGLHPSNTGYATIAFYFIKTINEFYHTKMQEDNIRDIYSGKKPYRFADPYAPQVVHDLEPMSNGHGGFTLRSLR
jgi:lysophospholipase L1-like esterase